MNEKGLECIFAKNEYGTYCIPKMSSHRPAAQHVIAGNVWEPDTIKFIRDNCGDGIVYTAGTYFGDFLPAMDVCKKVFAYEPSPENFKCAQITAMMNDLDNVTLSRAGLCDHYDLGFVQVFDQNHVALGGTSRIISPSDADSGSEEVVLTTIDRERKLHEAWEDVSIIQLDIEGFEEKALRGAENTIWLQRPILILEIWNPAMLESEYFKETIFGKFGYVKDGNLHDNVVLVAK